MFKFIISLLLLTMPVHATLNDVDKAFISPLDNKLANPGFENGKAKWTASAGTFTISTTSPIQGKAMGVWDAAASGNTLTATAASLKAGNIVGLCKIQVPSGTATHTLELYDGSNILASTTFESSTSAIPVYVNAVLGSDDDINLRLYANADEVSVNIDGCYLGPADGVNIGSVAQAQFVGGMESAGASSCAYSENTSTGLSTFVDLGTGTSCAAWSVTGAVTAQGTGDHRLVLASTSAGEYVFKLSGAFYTATTGQTCIFRLSDGTNTYQGQAILGTADTMVPGLEFHVTNTTGGAKTYKLQAADNGAGFCQWANLANYPASWKVYKFPSSSQMVQKFDQTNIPWTSYTPTFTGFGTVSVQSFFWRRVGQNMEILGKFTAGTTTAVEARISLPGSFVSNTTSVPSIRKVGSATQSTAIAGNIHVLMESGTAYMTFGYETASVAGLAKSNGSTFVANGVDMSIQASIPIQGWNETNNIGLVKHSVVTSSDGVWAVESARFTNTGSCAVATQSGTWITGVSDPGVGTCGITIGSGIFSSAPICICSAIGSSQARCTIDALTTTTALQVDTRIDAGLSDVPFYITCSGPR